MKRYVYTKEAKRITVETDAFAKIDNFVVTGIFKEGDGVDDLIHAGFDIVTGDTVTKAKMMNLAKVCECQLDVYGANGSKDEDTSVDLFPSLKDLKLAIVKDEPTYNQLMPEEYKKKNTWSSISSKAPFLVATFNRIDANDKYNMTVKAKAGVATADTAITFAAGVSPTWGTGGGTDTLTTTQKEYLVFAMNADLQIADGISTKKKWKVEMTYQSKTYSAEVAAS